MAPRSFSILYVAEDAIGEALLSSGLLKRLLDDLPGAKTTVVAGSASAPLFADLPGLEALIVMRHGGLAEWFGLWNRLRLKSWDLIVDLRGTPLSGMLRRKRRAVRAPRADVVHPVVTAAQLLTLEGDPPAPYLFTGEAVRQRAAELTGGVGPLLAIGPGAAWMGKVWPSERYAMTAVTLLEGEVPMAGGRLMLVGDPAEIRDIDTLRRTLPRSHLIDLTGLDEPLLVYACLARARLFIGGDSEWMHMAAAAGAPTLGLFGPSDEQIAGPWGDKARVVRGPRLFEQFVVLDPHLNQALGHMTDLSVEAVVGAAMALLAATEPKHD
jgi:ADP-heptose:LPS heptosyltransferase